MTAKILPFTPKSKPPLPIGLTMEQRRQELHARAVASLQHALKMLRATP